MNNLKMVLHDDTELAMEQFGLPMHAVFQCVDNADMQSKWDLFTPDKLMTMKIKQNDSTIFTFASVTLDGLQCVMNGDGSVTAHFYFAGTNTSTIDTEYAEAGKILLGEEA